MQEAHKRWWEIAQWTYLLTGSISFTIGYKVGSEINKSRHINTHIYLANYMCVCEREREQERERQRRRERERERREEREREIEDKTDQGLEEKGGTISPLPSHVPF